MIIQLKTKLLLLKIKKNDVSIIVNYMMIIRIIKLFDI